MRVPMLQLGRPLVPPLEHAPTITPSKSQVQIESRRRLKQSMAVEKEVRTDLFDQGGMSGRIAITRNRARRREKYKSFTNTAVSKVFRRIRAVDPRALPC